MGEKDVDTLMERLKNYTSNNSVKQKPKNQSNIDKSGEIADLFKKNDEWRKKSLTEKLDYYEKNVKGNSEQYDSLIKGEIIDPILNALPRCIDIEKWVYKNRELKIIFDRETSIPMFESDYNQLLKDYPCVRKVISGIKKKGIKVIYDRKNMMIRASA